ncbi:MAG: hypothetical protein ACTS73_07800 [Arsenophonus sp. NEOnobi-MAG3]
MIAFAYWPLLALLSMEDKKLVVVEHGYRELKLNLAKLLNVLQKHMG